MIVPPSLAGTLYDVKELLSPQLSVFRSPLYERHRAWSKEPGAQGAGRKAQGNSKTDGTGETMGKDQQGDQVLLKT